MAGFALVAEPPLVYIVLEVASGALSRRSIVERLTLVARQAARFDVSARQCETGLAVIKSRGLPVPVVMAFCALSTQRLLVHIALRVASDAIDRRVLEPLVAMAIRALHRNVFPGQGKAGLRMVELRRLPGTVVVTPRAIGTKLAPVDIITAMASDALFRRILEGRCLVTRRAFCPGMPAPERKPALVVIELRLFPVRFDMASLAVGAESALVHVVLAMTCGAVARRLPVLLSGRVASAALQRRMLAQQQEVSLSMIKPTFVEDRYFRLPAKMFGVAFAAWLLPLDSPVESGLADDVLADLLVAVKAQGALALLAKRFMAIATEPFDIGMAFDHLAGHDQRLHRVGAAGHGTKGDGKR